MIIINKEIKRFGRWLNTSKQLLSGVAAIWAVSPRKTDRRSSMIMLLETRSLPRAKERPSCLLASMQLTLTKTQSSNARSSPTSWLRSSRTTKPEVCLTLAKIKFPNKWGMTCTPGSYLRAVKEHRVLLWKASMQVSQQLYKLCDLLRLSESKCCTFCTLGLIWIVKTRIWLILLIFI